MPADVSDRATTKASQATTAAQGATIDLRPDRDAQSNLSKLTLQARHHGNFSHRNTERQGRHRRRTTHWPFLLTTSVLTSFGVLMVFSASQGQQRASDLGPKQAAFAAVGLALLLRVGSLDYRRLRKWNPWLMVVTGLALGAVLSPLGTEVRGTQGWFRVGPISIQPSEFAKLTLILALAVLFSANRNQNRTAIDPLRFVVGLSIVAFMTAAVLAQGEAGTVLVLGAIALVVFVVAGVSGRHLLLLGLTAAAVVAVVIQRDLLAPYQLARFQAFLDPSLDPQGIGYNQQQALTAIGSGGITGSGLFQGPQTQLGYLPDQHTDFIFAAVAEELGLLGALAVLGLEIAILAFIFDIGRDARDQLGRLLCAGVFAMIGFQVVQNTAMNLRMAPITGISLPLMSYGGSSLLTILIGLGLVHSVTRHPGPAREPARQARMSPLNVMSSKRDRLRS